MTFDYFVFPVVRGDLFECLKKKHPVSGRNKHRCVFNKQERERKAFFSSSRTSWSHVVAKVILVISQGSGSESRPRSHRSYMSPTSEFHIRQTILFVMIRFNHFNLCAGTVYSTLRKSRHCHI